MEPRDETCNETHPVRSRCNHIVDARSTAVASEGWLRNYANGLSVHIPEGPSQIACHRAISFAFAFRCSIPDSVPQTIVAIDEARSDTRSGSVTEVSGRCASQPGKLSDALNLRLQNFEGAFECT